MSVTTPEPPPATRSRAQMIADRRKNSALWRVIHWLGSLQLALLLLATIAIACAVATFAESSFNTRVAQAYIYKAPWFQVWLAVLCVNLLAVTLTRWPWQKKHLGFVITHYGIITLLAGAVVGMNFGFEGNVTLKKDAPPVNWVTTSKSIIRVENPLDGAVYTLPFSADTARLGNGRTRTFRVPGSQLTVVADEFSANMVDQRRLVPSDAATAGPGVALRLTSSMMGQTVNLPLAIADGQPDRQDFFGLAQIGFYPSLPEAAKPLRESQLVFARFAPVVSGPVPSQYQVHLSEDGQTISVIEPHGGGVSFPRETVIGKEVPVGGAVFSFEQYWPDFYMKDGVPSSRSDSPNNPGLLVQVSFSAEGHGKPTLELAPAGDEIAYRLNRDGRMYGSGQAVVGKPFPLSWADWQAQVVEILPRAAVVTEVMPGPPLTDGSQGVPGFRAHLVTQTGEAGPSRWLESGKIESLTAGPYSVRFGYGLEVRPLPFSLRLVKFEVPRDEGTDTPADFRATVEFKEAATGETKSGVARMNNPASFPGTFWANITGINYKFSQAEWNPTDLDQTTLQVLYDPGWLLKWVGSLGICVGIGLMFYWKPKKP